VFWDCRRYVKVVLDSSSPLLNHTCGLCGNADGSLVGERANMTANNFWKVGDGTAFPELLPLETNGGCTLDSGMEAQSLLAERSPCTDDKITRAAQLYCAQITNVTGPYAACHGVVNTTEIYDNCVFDHCATADEAHACDSYMDLERACRNAGVLGFDSVVNNCDECFVRDRKSCLEDIKVEAANDSAFPSGNLPCV
jgi:hypothetical protein